MPLAEECGHLFAFTYREQQFTYTQIPQGFKYYPHSPHGGTLIQYVDDLLICSPFLEQSYTDSMKVLQRLAEGGHKVSKTKLQYCQPQVEYLGRTIAHGTKATAPGQLEGISKAPLPQTVAQMMTFLGMTGFSSDWIQEYVVKTAPLREIMKEAGQLNLRAKLNWNNDALVAFETLKKEMQTATSLSGSRLHKAIFVICSKQVRWLCSSGTYAEYM